MKINIGSTKKIFFYEIKKFLFCDGSSQDKLEVAQESSNRNFVL
jgi:hypothetical protein